MFTEHDHCKKIYKKSFLGSFTNNWIFVFQIQLTEAETNKIICWQLWINNGQSNDVMKTGKKSCVMLTSPTINFSVLVCNLLEPRQIEVFSGQMCTNHGQWKLQKTNLGTLLPNTYLIYKFSIANNSILVK